MDKRIVICGGGVMGCATAYYFAKRGVKTTVVEQCSIACGASGKACAMLPREWEKPGALKEFSMASFDLHMELANDFPECGYRRIDACSVALKEGAPTESETCASLPSWVDGPAVKCEIKSDCFTTAQVDPHKLTNTLMAEAKRLVGSELIIGSLESITKCDDRINGVIVDGNQIQADVVILAMGPWLHTACDWLKIPPINRHRVHSIVIRPKSNDVTTPHAILADLSSDDLEHKKINILPRPDGNVFISGIDDNEGIPANQNEVNPNQDALKQLHEIGGKISSYLQDSAIIEKGASYTPVPPPGNLPIIGSLPDVDGAYMAFGGYWGVLNAPAVGLALSELVVDGECKMFDLAPFEPAQFI